MWKIPPQRQSISGHTSFRSQLLEPHHATKKQHYILAFFTHRGRLLEGLLVQSYATK